MNKVFLTVFTPTYNRAYTLENLYHSLCKQTDFDFEWLIVDDGSTDNTSSLVEKFISNENSFKICYFYKDNGGKHTAINKGVELAKGRMFFIVDSDDVLIEDAVHSIKEWEKTISGLPMFAGVSGNKGYSNYSVIGTTFEGDFVDATALERNKFNISGDKSEVFYTDILKKYKFPEFSGERFVTENVVWNRIAYDGYKIRWFNKIIYITEYLEDGLTSKYSELLANNPKGFALSVLQDVKFYNYGIKDKVNMYFYYLDAVKQKVGLFTAAKHLKISKINALLIWICLTVKIYLFRVIKRK